LRIWPAIPAWRAAGAKEAPQVESGGRELTGKTLCVDAFFFVRDVTPLRALFPLGHPRQVAPMQRQSLVPKPR